MLVGDFVLDDWDENIKFVRDGSPLLSEKILAKYFKDCQVGWKRYAYRRFHVLGCISTMGDIYPLDSINRKDLPLPEEFDGNSIWR